MVGVDSDRAESNIALGRWCPCCKGPQNAFLLNRTLQSIASKVEIDFEENIMTTSFNSDTPSL